MFLLSIIFHITIVCLILWKQIGLSLAGPIISNPYQVLNLTTTHIENSELKQKYRALAKKYHPDKYIHNSNSKEKIEDINAKFLEVTSAYEMLNNKPRNDDTIDTLNLDLSYFYSGKNIKYTHHRKKKCICPICKGSGVPEGQPPPQVCTVCGGQGTARQTIYWVRRICAHI